MHDLKKDVRDVTNETKEAWRRADGDEDLGDKAANLGDDVRDALGNAGDMVRDEIDDRTDGDRA